MAENPVDVGVDGGRREVGVGIGGSGTGNGGKRGEEAGKGGKGPKGGESANAQVEPANAEEPEAEAPCSGEGGREAGSRENNHDSEGASTTVPPPPLGDNVGVNVISPSPLDINPDHFPDTASVVSFGPKPIPIPISPTTTDRETDTDAEDTTLNEDDLETPKASMFLTRHGIPPVRDPLLPRPGISRVNSSLSIQEDYIPNPLATAIQAVGSSTRPVNTRHQAGAGGSAGLTSQPTTAISLPEGVLAQQQQPPNANRVTSSRGTSITGAPSFSSDAGSFVPTLDGRGNDVEGMLGEILSMGDGGMRWWGDESSAASGLHYNTLGENNIGDTGGVDGQSMFANEEDEESSDEERDKGMSDEARISRWRGRKKHFFILSGAGKPVYSRHGNESGTEQMLVSGYMGVIQTIISFFHDSGGGSGGSGDSLRSFVAGKCKFVIVKEEGAVISRCGEQVAFQVVATLTVSALTKVFTQREGFDLRRLLGGTEVFLDGLSDTMTRGDPGTLLSALECVRLQKRERERVHGVLLKGRSEKLLYGMVVADGRLVGVVRPRRHSLHPMDLQVVFGMLFNASTFRDSGGGGSAPGGVGIPPRAVGGGGEDSGTTVGAAGEYWIPICLPKFNSTGYLYAYIHFWRRELAIVFISADPSAFFDLRTMKGSVIAKLDSPDPPSSTSTTTTTTTSTLSPTSLTSIIEASLSANRYSVDEVLASSPRGASHTHLPRVLHFLYKSRRNVQFTMPSWEPHFSTQRARRRAMCVYQALHAKVHKAQNGGGLGLKVHFERVGGWIVVAWVEGGWEVYVVAQGSAGDCGGVGGSGITGVGEEEKRELAEAAERIVRWVGREEERVFVVGGAVF
ncbi:trafficking protein Mon1-domain-containing protein [Tirmania nivea]|nr:trafficking protein Mon1-domain-containing protein [Tirmania nivea]